MMRKNNDKGGEIILAGVGTAQMLYVHGAVRYRIGELNVDVHVYNAYVWTLIAQSSQVGKLGKVVAIDKAVVSDA
jgi:hypothetical protein